MKRAIWVISAVVLLLLPPMTLAADKIACRIFMYKKNQERIRSTTVFSPQDQIVVHATFVRLPKGEYTFQAEWYNPLGELQDASRYDFSLPAPSDQAMESWLEISKAGFLTQLFSASETTGYNIKFYGRWQVKLFLNGENVGDRYFEIK